MGRRARIPKDPPIKKVADRVTIVTDPRILSAAGAIMLGSGFGLLGHSIAWAAQNGFKAKLSNDALTQALRAFSYGFGGIGIIIDILVMIMGTFDEITGRINGLIKELKSANIELENEEKSLNETLKWLEGAGVGTPLYESSKIRLDVIQKKYDKAKAKVDAIIDAIQDNYNLQKEFRAGIGLIAAGSAIFAYNNPKVVEASINAGSKVACQLIDETDQVIKASGAATKDIINSLYPWKGIV